MLWKLEVWFGYNGWINDDHHKPAVDEDFETKPEAVSRGQEVLAEGYTVNISGVHFHFPASAITKVKIGEYEPPEEEE